MEKNSYYSQIMSQNKPQKSENYLKTKDDQGVLLVMDFHTQLPNFNTTEHLRGY